jgi:multidrug efflux system membrane fusion protein
VNFLTDIRQIDPADIRFNITQAEFLQVQEAMKGGNLKFQVLLPQDPTKPREGTIYFTDNHIDTTTGTILLRGTVSNKDEMFWPGEFIRVRLLLKTQPNAILVPEESVKIGQDGAYVYIYHADTSTVEYRLVEKGEKVDQYYVIEKGVKPGEKIIMKGQDNLTPKAKVYIPAENEKK